MEKEFKNLPVIRDIADAKEICWINPETKPWQEVKEKLAVKTKEIDDAQERLFRFAPFIRKCFPETAKDNGIIESDIAEIPEMKKYLERMSGKKFPGTLLLKKDSHLAVAGSVKARGGIYEVLKHTEDLALNAGLLSPGDNYALLTEKKCREFFSQYKIQVGSTGNLGLSIGIASAAIGYQVTVHMSADAKQWKKDLLRKHGVTVTEYESDYSEAVKRGRQLSDADPKSYFVDDENSKSLFLGYAVAARRLKKQLEDKNICVDSEHPLFVYIPCGVGGAPGGITFGLKDVWGDNVHVFFVEPVQAPCMLLGMASGLHSDICVQDIGLTGQTHADGLAVGRASGFVGKVMEPLLSGEFTLEDRWLYEYMRALWKSENIFIEPSAAAAFGGAAGFMRYEQMQEYWKNHAPESELDDAVHIAWATGGRLVPPEAREEYGRTYLQ